MGLRLAKRPRRETRRIGKGGLIFTAGAYVVLFIVAVALWTVGWLP